MRRLIAILLFALKLAAADAPNPADLPPMPSPLEKFRTWLAMNEAEREKALAAFPAEKQKVLREKLRAYQILPMEQRNRRLALLELRWYLRPLMTLAASERAAQLKAVPPPLQPMVLDRLQAWDKLDGRTQAELLASDEARELVMGYFAQIRRGLPQSQILGSMPEAKRAQLQEAINSWNKTPAAELQRKVDHLSTFFETQSEDRDRTMAVFSPAEKADVQRTLDAFAQLPAAQRRACVNSFQKFASMPPEERNQFLRNAARWQEMTAKERAAWKQVVTALPPMPPEPEAPIPMPPMPEPLRANAAARELATNSPRSD